jgi:hypothetical protein
MVSLEPNLPTMLIAAMRKYGIARIEVEYSGYGDSGQIDYVYFYGTGGKDFDATGLTVPGYQKNYDWQTKDYIVHKEDYLTELAQDVVWYWLEEAHGGWEIDEGSDGKYALTLDENVLAVANTHNNHFTQTDTEESDFEVTP